MLNTTSLKTPLLEQAWATMPEGIRKTLSSEPIIPAIAAKAKKIAAEKSDFIRSDQGQIVGVFPKKEIYYGPSAGLEELRELVGQFWTYAYRLKNRPGVPPEGLDKKHVAITSGATEGLAILMHLFAYNQNVGLMSLHWSNYKGIIQNASGNPIVIDLFDKNYNPDFERAEKFIEENKITSILINFPNNPSGDVLSVKELTRLAELARKKNLIIIADEVYNFIRYKGEPQSMLSFAPERTVVVSSASKEYLIPGARVGYVLAADDMFTNTWMPNMIRSFSSSPNTLGQNMLIELLREEVKDFKNGRSPRIITEIKKELKSRCDLIILVLRDKGFTLAGRDKDSPSGAISVLARLPEDLECDDKAFVDKALELEKFSAVPASVFGAPNCIRFGYAGMTKESIMNLSQNLQDVLEFFRS